MPSAVVPSRRSSAAGRFGVPVVLLAGLGLLVPVVAVAPIAQVARAGSDAVASGTIRSSAVGVGAPATNGRIAYMSSRSGNYDIYAMNADGGGQTRLMSNTAFDTNPAGHQTARRSPS